MMCSKREHLAHPEDCKPKISWLRTSECKYYHLSRPPFRTASSLYEVHASKTTFMTTLTNCFFPPVQLQQGPSLNGSLNESNAVQCHSDDPTIDLHIAKSDQGI